jgi:hypothetical protein
MTSSYTPLGIEKMVTGENAGTWGTKTNANLDLIAQLTGGFAQVSIAGGAQTTALDVADGATTGTAQQRFIEFTGTITGNQIVTIPNDVETFYILKNSTTGSFTVEFKYATGSGTTFTFAATNKKTAIVQASASPDATNPNIIEVQTGGDVVDDTSPQLGGNLDVNGNSIVSVSNGDIAITPDGSGNIVLDGLTFPNADGSANQALVTDGAGNLSFATAGRLGTVNWCSTAKTAPFSATDGAGFFVNTAGGAVTVTLPSSPSAGAIVSIKDYNRTFGTNNVTLDRNGSKINSVCENATLSSNGQSISMIYVDATKGWIDVKNCQTSTAVGGAQFVNATGGTIYECGNFRVHHFASDGTFTVTNAGNPSGSSSVDYLVVAGGGGTGPSNQGGGGGGFRFSASTYCMPVCAPSYPNFAPAGVPVSVTAYPVAVGGGGGPGVCGSNSIFSTITSAGGGKGASCGGSGGGGPGGPGPGGQGNTPPVSPPQGNPGGGSNHPAGKGGGGGGGPAPAGIGISSSPGGRPGSGGQGGGLCTSFKLTSPFLGEAVGSPVAYYYFSGGGAGTGPQPAGGGPTGTGGFGGGGNAPANQTASSGDTNTGGGAGAPGQSGGSGYVVIRYKFQ